MTHAQMLMINELSHLSSTGTPWMKFNLISMFPTVWKCSQEYHVQFKSFAIQESQEPILRNETNHTSSFAHFSLCLGVFCFSPLFHCVRSYAVLVRYTMDRWTWAFHNYKFIKISKCFCEILFAFCTSHRIASHWMILEIWIVFNIHFHSYDYFRWILNLKSKSFHTFNKCKIYTEHWTYACLIRCTTKLCPKYQITKNCDVQNWFSFPNKCVHRSYTWIECVSNIKISKCVFNSKINKSKKKKALYWRRKISYNISSLNLFHSIRRCVFDVVRLFDFDWTAQSVGCHDSQKLINCMQKIVVVYYDAVTSQNV